MAKQKPQLVLLHGLFGSPLGLAEITNDLREAGYEVFVPAVPPFAGTEAEWAKLDNSMQNKADLGSPKSASKTKTSGTKNISRSSPTADLDKKYADYFRNYFTENKITNPVLIGHSMGTLVATSIVEHHPDLVNEKIILLSPISQSPNALISKVSVLSAYLPQKLVDWITTQFLIVPRSPKFFRETLKQVNLCSHDQRPASRYIKEATEFSTGPSVVKKLSKTAATSKNFQLYLLAGEFDRVVPQKATREAVKVLEKLPNNLFSCRCEFLPQTGHLHNYEKPHETAQKIIAFLEE